MECAPLLLTDEPLYEWLGKTWQFFLKWKRCASSPGAFLIIGQKGLGQENLLKEMAALFICEHPQEMSYCGNCRGCYLYRQQTHPDTYFLGGERAITIDDIREVAHRLQQTFHHKAAVVTLFNVEALSVHSANALLKTLEEPPEHALFLLSASSLHRVLPTLASRCIKLHLPVPSQTVALSWLKKKFPKEPLSTLQWALLLGGRAPLSACAWLTPEGKLIKISEQLTNLMGQCSLSGLYEGEIQHWVLTRPQETLYLLYYWVVELIHQILYDSELTGFFSSYGVKTQFLTIAKKLSVSAALKFLAKVGEAIECFSLPGINKQLLFESLFCQWQHCIRGGKA